MTRLTPSRLFAVFAACAAVPVLVDSVRSADDGIFSVARLEEAAPLGEAKPEPVAVQLDAADGAASPQGPLADRLAPRPEHPDLAALRAALDAYRRGDLAGGDAKAATLDDPAARTVARWAALRLLPREAGYARIQAFLAEEPHWPGRGQMQRRAEEALMASRPTAEQVLAHFKGHVPMTAMGKLALARAWSANGRAAEAAALVRRSWREDDFSAEIENAVLDDFGRVVTPADHMARTERFLFGEDWADGLRCAARAGADYVKLAQARIAAAKGTSDMAALVDAVPKALQEQPAWLFAKAQVLRRKDKPQEAAQLLARAPRDAAALVAPEGWWTERRILARKLLDQGEQRLAYEVAAARPPGTGAYAIEGEFHAGWIALRFLSDPATAARHFADAARHATTPISVSRAAYWQGRAAEAAGADPHAFYETAARHGTTWYGQLARARLGRTDLVLQRPSASPTGPGALLGDAVRLLMAAGARDLALPLLADAAQPKRDPADMAAVATAVEEIGDARAQLMIGKAALQRGIPLESQAFPTGGIPLDGLATEGIETPLVLAVVRQESSFDPKAQSTAGARGLMQLMPATARETAGKLKLDFSLDRLTADPGYNAALGSAYLSGLAAEWRGSYILAIAAYNAGSGNVKKWVEAYGDPRNAAIDPIDWVERIPFTETRNYVQRVMENLQAYRSRMGDREAMLIMQDLRRGAPKGEASR
ncbi:lytic transglycosylase domain-containing protein [uncultured Alsobacter sp.]|uniref:lytic transglycosylase domain-containing protein n=1 Tax=uncultured Alsobacter sp. TaxID=1748258 RepID=UPI0025E1D22D|nr:lytic transglycosylase domain-containing protein [uncultured Alsobacter sp.]